mmetsp:Transcript_58749/g.163962  ORF Transcript_58749/g.163962 Transcript_58749/m.163962 type:complete len:232 (+) Transcript_58749:447-1142(+)
MPNAKAGRSLVCQPFMNCCCFRPLLEHQSKSLRSLSSTYSGFLSRKRSTCSKKPSSGKPTGTTTENFPPELDERTRGETSASSAAMSANIRHLKGNFFRTVPPAPRFTASVMFLKETVGYKACPTRCSGNGLGSPVRTPSRNNDIVLGLALFGSKLTTTPKIFKPVRLDDDRKLGTLSLSTVGAQYDPSSLKKAQLVDPSPRRSDDFEAETPIRSVDSKPWAFSSTFTSKA